MSTIRTELVAPKTKIIICSQVLATHFNEQKQIIGGGEYFKAMTQLAGQDDQWVQERSEKTQPEFCPRHLIYFLQQIK